MIRFLHTHVSTVFALAAPAVAANGLVMAGCAPGSLCNKNIHAKCTRHVCHGTAELAMADDAKRLAGQLANGVIMQAKDI